MDYSYFTRSVSLSYIALLLFASPLWATPIVYTDRSTFEAALGGITTADSLDTASIGHQYGGYDGPLFDFTGRYYGCEVGEACGAQTPAMDGRYMWLYSDASPYTLTFDFPITGIGFDYADAWPEADSYTLSVDGIDSPISAETAKFFGIIDNAGLGNDIELVINGNWLVWDSVTIGANAIPEPATLALMGLGLAGIGFSRKRKAA